MRNMENKNHWGKIPIKVNVMFIVIAIAVILSLAINYSYTNMKTITGNNIPFDPFNLYGDTTSIGVTSGFQTKDATIYLYQRTYETQDILVNVTDEKNITKEVMQTITVEKSSKAIDDKIATSKIIDEKSDETKFGYIFNKIDIDKDLTAKETASLYYEQTTPTKPIYKLSDLVYYTKEGKLSQYTDKFGNVYDVFSITKYDYTDIQNKNNMSYSEKQTDDFTVQLEFFNAYDLDPSITISTLPLFNSTIASYQNTTSDTNLNGSVRLLDDAVLIMNFDVNGSSAGKVTDLSKNCNDGVLSNAPFWNQSGGKYGSAYTYNGVNTYINVPHTANVNNFTVDFWMYKKANGRILTKQTGWNANEIFFALFGLGGDLIRLDIYSDTAGDRQTLTQVFNNNTWYHITITYDDGTKNSSAYVDGVFDSSLVRSNSPAQASAPILIGADYTGLAFNGSIDEVRIYNRSLSASEVLAINNSGRQWTGKYFSNGTYKNTVANYTANVTWTNVTASIAMNGNATPLNATKLWLKFNETTGNTIYDYSGNNYIGIIENNASRSENSISDYSIYFDKSYNQSINLDNNTSQFKGQPVGTISVWFKIDASTANVLFWIGNKSEAGTSTVVLGVTHNSWTGDFSNEAIAWNIHDGSASRMSAYVTDKYYDDGKWHHLTARMGTSENAIFIDGLKKTLSYGPSQGSSSTGGIFFNVTKATGMRIGERFVSNVYSIPFNGTIDEFMIFNTSLSDQEIYDLYKRQLTAKALTGNVTIQIQTSTDNATWTVLSDPVLLQDGVTTALPTMAAGAYLNYTINFNTNDTIVTPYLYSLKFNFTNATAPEPYSNVIIDQPTNTTYATANRSLNVRFGDSDGIDTCWYSLNNTANVTIVNCDNTTFIGIEKLNILKVYMNDTQNDTTMSNINFSIDTIAPILTYVNPTKGNNAIVNQSFVYVNATTNEVISQAWLYLTDDLTTPIAPMIKSAGYIYQNVTPVPDGHYEYTIRVNDTLNNTRWVNYRNITLDTQPPNPSFNQPQNTTYGGDMINLAYDVGDPNPTRCFYQINNGSWTEHVGCSPPVNMAGLLLEGSNNVTLRVNDTLNWTTTIYQWFTVDTLPPTLSIEFPIDSGKYNYQNISLNFTAGENVTHLDYCGYQIDGGSFTEIYGCRNTTVFYSEGVNNLNVVVNDTAGNQINVPISFQVDTIIPTDLILYSPANTTYNTRNLSIDLSFMSNDGFSMCWYSLNEGSNSTYKCDEPVSFLANEGSNKLTVAVNDTFNNTNSTYVWFTSDSIAPQLALQFPIDSGKYNYQNMSINYTVGDLQSLDRCFYQLNGGSLVELYGCRNSTMYLLDNGYTLNLIANDTAGNQNTTSISFQVDTSPPTNLSLSIPLNTTYDNNNLSIGLEFNSTDGFDTCGYVLNSDPISYYVCDQPVTFLSATGLNHLNVSINDTFGNINYTDVWFTVDMDNPNLHINSPTNTTYFTTNISLSFTSGDNTTQVDKMWYYLNGGAKTWIEDNANTTILAVDGSNMIAVWINDTAGNNINVEVFFFVDQDIPSLTIDSPTNTTYSTNNISINYRTNASDVCLYNLNGGIDNILTGCTNGTFIASEGFNTLQIYVNNTNGNSNAINTYFTVDTTDPHVSIQSPTNITYNYLNLSINYTFGDNLTGHIDSCYYVLDSNPLTSLFGCGNTTLLTTESSHSLNVYVNDTANNTYYETITFSNSLTEVNLSIDSPTNSTYTTHNISVTYRTNANDKILYMLNGLGGWTDITHFNITDLIPEGSNYITIRANNSNGNNKTLSVHFTIDTTTPALSLTSPTNTTYTTATIPITYSTDSTATSCYYTLNGGMQNSLPSCLASSMTLTNGYYEFRIVANDTNGLYNQSYVNFTVSIVAGNGTITLYTQYQTAYELTNGTIDLYVLCTLKQSENSTTLCSGGESCYMTVYNSTMIRKVDTQPMSLTGDGLYIYQYSPTQLSDYLTIVQCSNTESQSIQHGSFRVVKQTSNSYLSDISIYIILVFIAVMFVFTTLAVKSKLTK